MSVVSSSGKGKLWRAMAWLLLLVVLLAWAAHLLRRDDFMPIETLYLQGVFERVDGGQLKRVVESNIDGNFFTLDIQRLHRQVTALPWVQQAWIERVWPGALRVRVREQRPVAVWNDQALLNGRGEPFLTLPRRQLAAFDLPWLHAPEGNAAKVLAGYHDFAQALAPLALKVAQVSMDERGSWSLSLDNGMRLMLGRKNRAQRLSRFLGVYAKYFQQQTPQPRYVDLRYANGFAIDWGHGGAPHHRQKRETVS